MDMKLEIRGSNLVVSLWSKATCGVAGPGETAQIITEVCSASLPLADLDQAIKQNSRSRYKSQQPRGQ